MFLFFFLSCSLDYFEQDDSTSQAPEFTFFDATFVRSENNTPSLAVDVSQVEQYNAGSLTFAKDPSFTLYDSDEKISVLGFCDILSADTDKDEYTFYGNVSVISYENDAKINAENLRWDGDSEVFSGAKDEIVSISVGNIRTEDTRSINTKSTELFIEGSGFSASTLDFSYSFTGPVTGSIIEN